MDEKELFEETKKTHEAMKVWLEKADAERKQYGTELGATKSALEKINAQMDKLEDQRKAMEDQKKRIDDLETKLSRPGFGSQEGKKEASDEEKAFYKYCRKGDERLSPEEKKSLATDSNADGGFLMPENKTQDLIRKLIEFSPVRELANIITIGQGDSYESPAEDGDFGVGWVSERASRTETTSGTIRLERIPAHEMYAKPLATQKVLDDVGFNLDAWMQDFLGRKFAQLEGTAFISGTGSGQPEGLLTKSGITEVKTGDANLLKPDGIISLAYALPEPYANNATFLMARATVGAVRKLVDSQARYLWEPGLAPGQPPTLLGRPIREAKDMPAVAANAYPIIFGDIRAAYTVVDRMGVRVLRDPYSSKPFVEFYTTKRTGGQVVLAEALVKQKVSA